MTNAPPSAQPRETILFGAYPQTAAGDPAPIRWLVLQRADGMLLLSEFILDCKRYHREFAPTTWRDCDLRAWLNATFYPAAFTPAEQARIQTTRCTDNGENSADTDDRVFLLSVAQVKAYTDPHDGTAAAVRRRAVGTAFAKAPKPDGCRLYVYDKSDPRDYIEMPDGHVADGHVADGHVADGHVPDGHVPDGHVADGPHGCSWWWTRTQPQTRPDSAARAAFIGARSNIKTYGRVNLPYYGVRPALWLHA